MDAPYITSRAIVHNSKHWLMVYEDLTVKGMTKRPKAKKDETANGPKTGRRRRSDSTRKSSPPHGAKPSHSPNTRLSKPASSVSKPSELTVFLRVPGAPLDNNAKGF